MRTAQEFKPSALLAVLQGTTESSGAEFTVRSNKTQKEYTYRLKRKFFNGKWYTFAAVEKNYLEFHYLGHYFLGAIIYKRLMVETPAAMALAWFLRQVEQGKPLDEVTVFHFGRCLKCGRALTDSTSIELGMGPTCRG